jgi:hypothetical protein
VKQNENNNFGKYSSLSHLKRKNREDKILYLIKVYDNNCCQSGAIENRHLAPLNDERTWIQ